MSRHGYLEIGAGSTLSAETGQTVDWYEDGSPHDAFAGLTIQNINGKGCASFGKYYPDAQTRVLIRAFACSTENCVTNALRIISSNNSELLRVQNNGGVGIAQANPKERLHIGELMTFHDGGGKFMGFNAYWDNTLEQMKNMAGGRASVTIGIGDPVYSPDVFSISIDKHATNGGRVFNSDFKGMAINTYGNMGVGTLTPVSTLHVLGDVTIGAKQCTTAIPEGHKRLSVDGTIFAKQIYVKETHWWPDHVFDPNYELASLLQVNAYIQQHRHLPGIPTEGEVRETGVSLGMMQAKLLEKIEELTLYVIDLSEKNTELRRAMDTLKERIR